MQKCLKHFIYLNSDEKKTIPNIQQWKNQYHKLNKNVFIQDGADQKKIIFCDPGNWGHKNITKLSICFEISFKIVSIEF